MQSLPPRHSLDDIMNQHRGTFSYKFNNPGDHRFQNSLAGNNPPHYIRIVRVSTDSAVIACYTTPECKREEQIDLDVRYTLIRRSEHDKETPVEMYNGQFIIMWQNSYDLKFQQNNSSEPKTILKLNNQRQQSRNFMPETMIPVEGFPPN